MSSLHPGKIGRLIVHPALTKIIPMIPRLLKSRASWTAMLAMFAAGYVITGDGMASVDWMWKPPRDVMVDRVRDVRDSQHAAAEQFQDALSEFRLVVSMPETELERRYRRLNKAYEESAAAAEDISRRIDRVVSASNRLLKEWREELGAYNDPTLRRAAEQQFDQTRAQAGMLIESMRRIESSMAPVLALFRDQVLYLKHNLNASAVAALEGEAMSIEKEVDALIEDMNRSIAEADEFIQAMLAAGQA